MEFTPIQHEHKRSRSESGWRLSSVNGRNTASPVSVMRQLDIHGGAPGARAADGDEAGTDRLSVTFNSVSVGSPFVDGTPKRDTTLITSLPCARVRRRWQVLAGGAVS